MFNFEFNTILFWLPFLLALSGAAYGIRLYMRLKRLLERQVKLGEPETE
jgi:hypothetical protein